VLRESRSERLYSSQLESDQFANPKRAGFLPRFGRRLRVVVGREMATPVPPTPGCDSERRPFGRIHARSGFSARCGTDSRTERHHASGLRTSHLSPSGNMDMRILVCPRIQPLGRPAPKIGIATPSPGLPLTGSNLGWQVVPARPRKPMNAASALVLRP